MSILLSSVPPALGISICLAVIVTCGLLLVLVVRDALGMKIATPVGLTTPRTHLTTIALAGVALLLALYATFAPD